MTPAPLAHFFRQKYTRICITYLVAASGYIREFCGSCLRGTEQLQSMMCIIPDFPAFYSESAEALFRVRRFFMAELPSPAKAMAQLWASSRSRPTILL